MDATTLSATWQIIIGMTPFVAVILTWGLNEWNKRREERRKNKEERYTTFLATSNGFYTSTENTSLLKNEFIKELRLAWLYCPDDVIKKGNAFIQTVQTGRPHSDFEKERAFFEFVIVLRKEIYGKTELTQDDHHLWGDSS